ncbi:MAG: hypothetical protein M1835_001936 [Candelina submexicana]|nr:MAG: hypothetical protein M1835_001936 [Candelina submexicana]
MDNSTLKQINRYVNGRMLVDHQVSLRARRKDTLSAEDLGILLRCHWVYDTSVYSHERQRVQMGLIMLFSAFTGTRPGVLLPQNKATKMRRSDGNGSGADLLGPDQISSDPFSDRSKNVRANSNPLKSDLPAHTQVNRRPRTVCYKDIELYLLRNPDSSQRDIFIAEIEFVNLKGSKEGEDGTIFMMHEDTQLAYCPIAHILALAFADDALESSLLTPEYICQLKVPKRLSSLPLRWKKSHLDIPLFRHTIQTEYGVRIHPTLPMKYDTSNSSLRQLGETAGYRYPIKSYCFRRWTANEANPIHCDIQSVVLLRPPQDALCRAAAQMNRNWDPLALRSLTEKQLQTLRRMPHLIQLRREKDTLRKQMAGSVQDEQARGTDLSKRHAAVGKELARLRAAYR